MGWYGQCADQLEQTTVRRMSVYCPFCHGGIWRQDLPASLNPLLFEGCHIVGMKDWQGAPAGNGPGRLPQFTLLDHPVDGPLAHAGLCFDLGHGQPGVVIGWDRAIRCDRVCHVARLTESPRRTLFKTVQERLYGVMYFSTASRNLSRDPPAAI